MHIKTCQNQSTDLAAGHKIAAKRKKMHTPQRPCLPQRPCVCIIYIIYIEDTTGIVTDAGVWPSGLVRWLADFIRTVVGSNPSHDKDRYSHFVRPLAKGA